jgi:hypothetical protein
MSNLIEQKSQLIGRKFLASIGEPWDFTSGAGDNSLSGNILSIEIDRDDEPLILCSVSSFKTENVKVDHVIAVNRQMKSQDVLVDLCANKSVNCNFVYLKNGDILDLESFKSVLSDSVQKSWLIGSMKLV